MAIRRRLKASLVALMLAAAVVVVVPGAPAAAATTYSFRAAGGLVWGTITFTSSNRVTIKGNIYGQSSGPAYLAKAVYFAGNGRYTCVSTPLRRNSTPDIQRSYTDSLYCSIANIHQVDMFWYNNGRLVGEGHYPNPYAP